VVHLNNLHGYYINVPMLMKYLAKSGKKVVWTLHDTWALTGHSGACDYAGCERFETGCHHCPLTHGYPRSIVDRSARNYARKKKLFTAIKDLTVITPSDWLNGKVGRSYLKGKRIITVPNGVNTAVFKPAESDFKAQHGIADKMLIMGCASAWGKGKGLNDFVRLAQVLDDRFAIVMVGLKKEQIATMPQRIICVERTNSVQELARIYSAADLFVNLTYADVFSMVNREALCTGTPVLTYTTGGSAECINGKNGKAFAKGDLDAVIEYLSNTYCADGLDAGCLNDGDPCSKEDMANKYAEILQNKG
jgi:glycosyltransferase involved in cell wall biosynthesis